MIKLSRTWLVVLAASAGVFCLFAVLLAAIVGTRAATGVISMQETLQARTAQPTAQALAADLSTYQSWPVLVSDRFDSNLNVNDWSVGSNRQGTLVQSIGSGKYHWQIDDDQLFCWWSLPQAVNSSDFYLTVEAQNTSRLSSLDYGIVFRVDNDDNHYRLLISDDREYTVQLYHKEQWVILKNWSRASMVRPGQPNRITLAARGSHFTFLVNDEYLGELDDDRLPFGRVGLVALSSRGVKGAFDVHSFELRAPLAPGRANATATAQAFAPILATWENWPLVLSESFETNENGWPTGPYSDRVVKGSRTLENYTYVWTVDSTNQVVWPSVPRVGAVSDFYMAVDMKRVSGSAWANYGVIMRYQTNRNYYRVLMNDELGWRADIYNAGVWQQIVGWIPCEAIRPGDINRLGVIGQGSHFVVTINGEYAGQFDDDRLPSGQVGFIMTMPYGQGNRIEFSNLVIRSPQAFANATATANAAIAAATRQAQQTATAAPTQTAVAATLTPRAAWPIVLAHSFDNASDTKGWPVGTETNDMIDGKREIRGAVYRWTGTTTQQMNWEAIAATMPVTDFTLSVQARVLDGYEGTSWGAQFRRIDKLHFYRVLLSEDGTLDLERFDYYKFENLVTTRVPIVKKGEANRLTISAEGSHIMVLVNGQFAAAYEDANPAAGQVGLTVFVQNVGTTGIEFQEFELRAP